MRRWLLIIVAILGLTLLCNTTAYAYLPKGNFTYYSIEHSDYPDSYLVVTREGLAESLLHIDLGTTIDPPTNFTASASGSNINLSWATASGAEGTLVVKGETDYPSSPDDGVEVYRGALSSHTDEGANSEGATRYYSAWSYNTVNYSTNYATDSAGGAAMETLGSNILLFVIVLLSLALTISGFVLRRGSLALASMAAWMVTCVWGYIEASGVWGIAMGIFWISIAMIIVSGIEGAMILTRAEEKAEEEAEYPSALEEALRDMDEGNKARRERRREGR